MKTNKIIIAALGATAALYSCTKDTGNSQEQAKGEPTEVTFNLTSTRGTRMPTGAKEPGTDKENAVKTVEFYVFDSSGNLDTEVGKVGENAGNGYIKFEGPEMTRKIIVSAGDNKKFVALVNINLGPLGAGDTYETLKQKMSTGEFKAPSGGDNNSRNEDIATGFEMEGEATATIVANKIDNKVTITVSRLVSRIKAPTFNAKGGGPTGVELSEAAIKKLWGADATITNDNLSFEYEGYALINGLSKSDVAFIGNAERNPFKVNNDSEKKPVWDLWKWDNKTYLASDFNADGSYMNTYSGEVNGKWFLTGTEADNTHRVYVYENKPKTITTTEKQEGLDRNTVYALIIKGKLKVTNGDGSQDKERYWRVDLTRDDNYHIFRNCSYAININKITSTGEGTSEKAEEGTSEIIPEKAETAVDATIIISDWLINSYETEM